MDFLDPIARNEAILQNMLGAENELEAPQSRIETLLLALLEEWKSVGGGEYRVPASVEHFGDLTAQRTAITCETSMEDVAEADEAEKTVVMRLEIGYGATIILPLENISEYSVVFSRVIQYAEKRYYLIVDYTEGWY